MQGSGLADCTLSIKYQYAVGRRLGIVSCLREQAVNKFSDLVTNAALLVSTVARTLRAESCPKSRVIAIPLPKPLTAAQICGPSLKFARASSLIVPGGKDREDNQRVSEGLLPRAIGSGRGSVGYLGFGKV